MALQKALRIEGRAQFAGHFGAVAGLLDLGIGKQFTDFRAVEGKPFRRRFAVVLDPGPLEQHQFIRLQIDHALETLAGADRPLHRHGIKRQLVLDVLQQIDRIKRLAVHLVDQCDNRDVAQTADLDQFERSGLHALGGVEHHDRAVGSGERAIGVLGEVFVTRRVEQVEKQGAMFERHHRGGDGNPPLLLDLHPVRTRTTVLAARAHLPRHADGTGGQQHGLGQRGLAGVRM